jgi:hypothetical protein
MHSYTDRKGPLLFWFKVNTVYTDFSVDIYLNIDSSEYTRKRSCKFTLNQNHKGIFTGLSKKIKVSNVTHIGELSLVSLYILFIQFAEGKKKSP